MQLPSGDAIVRKLTTLNDVWRRSACQTCRQNSHPLSCTVRVASVC